jgi:hypothetical protein
MKYIVHKPNGSYNEVTSLEGLVSLAEILGEPIRVLSGQYETPETEQRTYLKHPYLVRHEE